MNSRQPLTIAAISMAGVHEAVGAVLPRVHAWVRRAATRGADMVLFPELMLGHYHGTPVQLDGLEVTDMCALARETRVGIGIGVGEQHRGSLYSTCILCNPDGSLRVHRKTRWQTLHCPISLGAKATAHEFCGLKVGIMICAEARFPETAQTLAAAGAQLFIMPHAYGATGPDWQSLDATVSTVVAARCRETGVPAVVVAATGRGLQGGFAVVDGCGAVCVCEIDVKERLHLFRQVPHD